ncbi:MAG: hypothetical protein AAB686_03385 [Patescibacteria group bacterium]
MAKFITVLVIVIIVIVFVVVAARDIGGRWGWDFSLDFGRLSRPGVAGTPYMSSPGTYISPPSDSGSGSDTIPIIKEPEPEDSVRPEDIPSGFTREQLSPYFGQVQISAAMPGSDNWQGQVSLRASGGDSINVSGWVIKSNRGAQYVPKAVDVYDSNVFMPETDIYLPGGGTLNIYTGTSAIGRNLRLNECLGYLENTVHFNPAIWTSCPVDRGQVKELTGACQNYISSLGTCKSSAANPLLPVNDYACQDFLSKLNYRGCFDENRFKPNFLRKEWYAWGGSRFLDQYHDRVLLFDKQGLLVDEYVY